jgi:SAM-dependent methyltransferase
MVEPLKFRPIHPFPARMAPSIALAELPRAKKERLRVLDPMAGSGTTLLAARSRGHEAYGCDTDPLALLIARVWCSDISQKAVMRHALAVHGEAMSRWRRIRQADAYPEDADSETKAFVRYWFDLTNRRQLRALADAIAVVPHGTRQVLWCAFSRLIIAKSRGASWAMDLAHSRPHKVEGKPPFRPLREFLKAVAVVVDHAPFSGRKAGAPRASVQRGDARSLSFSNGSFDIVITSPPYLNAIDYLRCNKFSLVWMGHPIPDLRQLRSTNIGTEASTSADPDAPQIRELRMLAHYVEDMDQVTREISRVLMPGGRCILVIGNCTMRGVFVRNSTILRMLGERHGLSTVSITSRDLPPNRRYLPPPSSDEAGGSLQGRMREEIVLTLAKGPPRSRRH